MSFPINVHTEDAWGNATADLDGLKTQITITEDGSSKAIFDTELALPNQGWTVTSTTASLPKTGDFTISASILDHHGTPVTTTTSPLTASATLPIPRPLFADLHVHSDDTVGTNSTTYNFSYARHIAGLDIVGYTANDFHITAARWTAALRTIAAANDPGRFVVFPGTEWCGNSAAGGDHNVVFIDDNPGKRHLRIHGVPVVGTGRSLTEVADAMAVATVVLAVPRASGKLIDRVQREASDAGLELLILPRLSDLTGGHVKPNDIRRVEIGDV